MYKKMILSMLLIMSLEASNPNKLLTADQLKALENSPSLCLGRQRACSHPTNPLTGNPHKPRPTKPGIVRVSTDPSTQSPKTPASPT